MYVFINMKRHKSSAAWEPDFNYSYLLNWFVTNALQRENPTLIRVIF